MKILLITHIYPPAVDGGSRVVYKISQYFSQKKHLIRILTSDCQSTDDFTHNNSPKITLKDSHVYRLPVYTFFHRPLKLISRLFPFLSVFSKGPLFKLTPFFLTFFKIIRFRPDLIIAGPFPGTSIIFAKFFHIIFKNKILLYPALHPTDPDFQNSLLLKICYSVDYIYTQTDFETKYFHQKLHIPLSKLINAGCGIDSSYFASKLTSATTPEIIFIGSFSGHKDIKTLIAAFSFLLPKYPDLKLTLAGQPTLYSSRLHLPANINLINRPTDDQIKNLIDNCTLLVLPSLQESFGIVLLEAWARYKPVIVSDIPVLTELITKTNGGITFKATDPHDLALKIQILLNSPLKAKTLAISGHQYTKNHFTWDKIGKNICQRLGC